tara:strand:+ start:5509 stop:6111 length:603 start_codon:yes stop_codon:yes gene_type:complete
MTVNYKQARKYLHKYGKSIVKQAKRILKQKKKSSSGNLISSIKYKVKFKRGKFDIEFDKAKYGEFIDKGVKGLGRSILPDGSTVGQHGTLLRPNRTYIDPVTGKRKRSPYKFRRNASRMSGGFYSSLDSWIARKGINIVDDNGKPISKKSLRYIIARGIKAKGIQGVSFYSQPLAATRKEFRKRLMNALKADVLQHIKVK